MLCRKAISSHFPIPTGPPWVLPHLCLPRGLSLLLLCSSAQVQVQCTESSQGHVHVPQLTVPFFFLSHQVKIHPAKLFLRCFPAISALFILPPGNMRRHGTDDREGTVSHALVRGAHSRAAWHTPPESIVPVPPGLCLSCLPKPEIGLSVAAISSQRTLRNPHGSNSSHSLTPSSFPKPPWIHHVCRSS